MGRGELPGNDDLIVEQDGHVVTVTMNRPEAKNAWSGLMIEGMAAAWEWIDAEPSVRVAILTGAGGTFCAGADLKDMSSRRSEGDDGFADRVKGANVAFTAMLRNHSLSKPLIAAVEGYAVAGGTEILQATDIRIAGESARFGLAEVQRALFPIGGSTVRLQRQVPFTKAMEILLTGEQIDAAEALRIGLVGRVVPDGEALNEARRIANRIARNGPLAVQAIKRSARETASLPEEEALKLELEIGMRVFASEDAKEGPRAFAEKRDPRFQGK
ncbi:MAG: crotonase/enoyl-CoA hydratase family protein [Actinobacteria bacterium]|nr:crotonase/enoyl-CoA hydratase family protein [Actinomycetota bacterium]